MAKGLFPTYHPAVCMLYFVAAIVFAFCSMQPGYVVTTAVMACAYLVYLAGWRRLGRVLVVFAPLVILVALLNSLFNTAGSTVVWKAGPLQLTVEGMAYGLMIGLMLLAVLTWFGCYNEVMTEDKFTYLFGRVAPTISLVISMISRWVPTMAHRGRVIYDSQEALIGGKSVPSGEDGDGDDAGRARSPRRRRREDKAARQGVVRRATRLASVLVGLGLEDSIQTSDSMRARGWGLARRTSYASYPWHAREYVVLVFLLVMIVLNAALLFPATAQFAYYPTMSRLHLWWGYIPYVIMLATPFWVELEELGHR